MQKEGTPHPKARARPLTPEHKQRISAALTGRRLSNTHCQNISIAKRGEPSNNAEALRRLYAEGKLIPWWIEKGLPHPATTVYSRQRDSEAHKGQIPWNKGTPWHSEIKEKNRLKHLGVKRSFESRRKQAQTVSGENNVSKRPEVKWKISQAHKKAIQNGTYNPVAWVHKIPTMPEKRLIEIIAKNFLPYCYVGDGTTVIGGLNPDFINCDGKKKLIEIFGRVFHDPNISFKKLVPLPQQETYRKAIYASLGFDCLVLWDDEMKKLSDEEIASIIRKFTKSRHKPTAQLALKVD